MHTPRECTEDCTAMSKASLGRTSPCLLSWESPNGSPNVEIWPSVPIVTTTPESETSRSSLLPSCLTEIPTGSRRSFVMNLPMPSSSILEKMRYGAWLDSMARSCQEALSAEPTESLKSCGENRSTMTIFSSKPSPEAQDQDPDTWGSEETQ